MLQLIKPIKIDEIAMQHIIKLYVVCDQKSILQKIYWTVDT